MIIYICEIYIVIFKNKIIYNREKNKKLQVSLNQQKLKIYFFEL